MLQINNFSDLDKICATFFGQFLWHKISTTEKLLQKYNFYYIVWMKIQHGHYAILRESRVWNSGLSDISKLEHFSLFDIWKRVKCKHRWKASKLVSVKLWWKLNIFLLVKMAFFTTYATNSLVLMFIQPFRFIVTLIFSFIHFERERCRLIKCLTKQSCSRNE